jgi:Flp pilus assembly protein TadG
MQMVGEVLNPMLDENLNHMSLLSKKRNRTGNCLQRSLAQAQAAVEFALVAPVALVLMLVGAQYAILGLAALGLSQANYQGARYAAVNSSASQSTVTSYILSVASPIITASSGKYLTVNMSPAPPCTFGSAVTVSVSFDLNHLVVLPNPFMGMVTFPSTISNSESAFCE